MVGLLSKLNKRVDPKRAPSSDAIDGARSSPSSGAFRVPIATTVHNQPIPSDASAQLLETLVTEPIKNPLNLQPTDIQLTKEDRPAHVVPPNEDPWAILLPLCTELSVTDIHIGAQGEVAATRQWQTTPTDLKLTPAGLKALTDLLAVQIGSQPSADNPIAIGGIDTPISARAALACRTHDGALSTIHLRIPRLNSTLYDLIHAKMLPASLGSWITEALASRCVHVAIVGSPASGRTTLAGALTHGCPSTERIVALEPWSEIAPPARELTRIPFGAGLQPLSAHEATTRLDWAFKLGADRIIASELPSPHSNPQGGALLARLFSSTVPVIAEFQSGDAEGIKSLLASLNAPLPILVINTLLHDRKPLVFRVTELFGGSEQPPIPLIEFAGLREQKRIWERQHMDASEIAALLRDRGHELKIGSTLVAMPVEKQVIPEQQPE